MCLKLGGTGPNQSESETERYKEISGVFAL